MKKRFLRMLSVLVLVLIVSPLAQAQDENTCYNLSEEDCALIASAAEDTAALTSFNQTFTLDVQISGLEVLGLLVPGLPPEIMLNVEGSGPLTTLPDTPDAQPALALDMLVDFDDGTTAAEDVEVPFVVVDDTVYAPGDGEIVSFPFEALGNFEIPMIGNLIPLDIAALIESDPATVGEFVPEGLGAALNPSGTPIDFAVNYVRLDDEDLDGQTVYPFQFMLDIGEVLNSEEFLGFVSALGPALGSDAQNADPMASLVIRLLPSLLAGVESDVLVTQYVGADDNLIHLLTFDFDFAVDLAVLTGAAIGGEETTIPPVSVNVLFDVTISDANSEFTIEAPADARPLTQEEIDGLFEFSMPGMTP